MGIEPGDDVAGDPIAAGLAQQIVAKAVVDPQRLVAGARSRNDVAAARRRGQLVDGAVDREQRHRQPVRPGPQPHDPVDHGARRPRRAGVLADQRIAIHLGDDLRERREPGVRGHQDRRIRRQPRDRPDRRRLDRRRIERQRGRRQDQTGERRLTLDRVQTRHHATHAVAVEEHRAAGLLRPHPREHRVEIEEEVIDPIDRDARPGRPSMSAHVERPHRVAGRDQLVGELGIAR
jgi:hypothetical protein